MLQVVSAPHTFKIKNHPSFTCLAIIRLTSVSIMSRTPSISSQSSHGSSVVDRRSTPTQPPIPGSSVSTQSESHKVKIPLRKLSATSVSSDCSRASYTSSSNLNRFENMGFVKSVDSNAGTVTIDRWQQGHLTLPRQKLNRHLNAPVKSLDAHAMASIYRDHHVGDYVETGTK